MKKVLSVLLVLALAMGFGVCAFAAPEPGVKTVTGIEAVWNGEIAAIIDERGHHEIIYFLIPYFTPENVEITLHFEEDEPEKLTAWEVYNDDWSWYIYYSYDAEASAVTFYYQDSSIKQSSYESYEDYIAALPQTAITIPADFLQKYMDSLKPWTELQAGESKKAVLTKGKYEVFTFTPEADGLHYFYSENAVNAYPRAWLTDTAFTDIGGFNSIVELQAGKTYFLFVFTYTEEANGECDVIVSSDVRKLSGWQWVSELLSGGLFNRYWVRYSYYYSLPGKGSWTDNAKHNWAIAAGWIKAWLFPRPMYM